MLFISVIRSPKLEGRRLERIRELREKIDETHDRDEMYVCAYVVRARLCVCDVVKRESKPKYELLLACCANYEERTTRATVSCRRCVVTRPRFRLRQAIKAETDAATKEDKERRQKISERARKRDSTAHT